MNLDQGSFPYKLGKSERASPEEGPAGVAGDGAIVKACPSGRPTNQAGSLYQSLHSLKALQEKLHFSLVNIHLKLVVDRSFLELFRTKAWFDHRLAFVLFTFSNLRGLYSTLWTNVLVLIH